MPEYSESDEETTIPNLFPARLLDTCLSKVQGMVRVAGERVEIKAKREAETCRYVMSFEGKEATAQQYCKNVHKIVNRVVMVIFYC